MWFPFLRSSENLRPLSLALAPSCENASDGAKSCATRKMWFLTDCPFVKNYVLCRVIAILFRFGYYLKPMICKVA